MSRGCIRSSRFSRSACGSFVPAVLESDGRVGLKWDSVNPIQISLVAFENRTTRTELNPLPRTAERPAQFVCFLEQGILLELPPRTCAKGHKIQIELDARLGDKL